MTWTPNGYGLHYLTSLPAGVMAVVEDHLTHAVGVFIHAHRTVRQSAELQGSVAEAKA